MYNNRYTIGRTIDKGGNGKLKVGYDQSTNQQVAFKMIRNKNLQAPRLDCMASFIREAETLKQLSHPNIIKYLDFVVDFEYRNGSGRIVQRPALIMEYAEKGDFFSYVVKKKFSDPIIRYYFRQLIDGLEYLHGEKYVHRDLKLENLLVDANFNLKIADFGYASKADKHNAQNILKTHLGTTQYKAPEMNSLKDYEAFPVDIFSCGVILFATHFQTFPFGECTPTNILFRQFQHQNIQFWQKHKCTTQFSTLLNGMMDPNPTLRWNIQKIKASEWFNGEIATQEEAQLYLKKIEDIIRMEKVSANLKQNQKYQIQGKPNQKVYRAFWQDQNYTYYQENVASENGFNLQEQAFRQINDPLPNEYLLGCPPKLAFCILVKVLTVFKNVIMYQISKTKPKVKVYLRADSEEEVKFEVVVHNHKEMKDLSYIGFYREEGLVTVQLNKWDEILEHLGSELSTLIGGDQI